MCANHSGQRMARIWIYMMWLLPAPFFLELLLKNWKGIFVLLPMYGLWSAAMIGALYTAPRVDLTDEGISVRGFCRKKVYPWDQIIQAGILCRMGRVERYNELVLLKTGGSPRGYQDPGFLLRNAGKVIRMAATKEICAFVIAHYGPLDFDLSDGRS